MFLHDWVVNILCTLQSIANTSYKCSKALYETSQVVIARYMLLIRVVDKTLHIIYIVHMHGCTCSNSLIRIPGPLLNYIYTVKYSSIFESQIYTILAVLNIATLMMIPLNAWKIALSLRVSRELFVSSIIQVCLMSQSWDNVASMLLTVHAHKT